ncbi:MAG: host-nuclease inhibitor Gam family protein [Succinivibrionaceae bacterium]|nr:host-nuclease inhibitor Gam family protein [Succinivibrionaceae bacterium]
MKIKNLKDVEETIKCIAKIDAEISAIDNDATKAINEARENAAKASAGLSEEREKLIESLKAYSDANRADLYEEGKKSRDFINGTIGYRQNPDKVEVAKDTADLLIAAGFANCVKVKKEPVKAALKNFDAAQQEKFHISFIPGEESFYCKAAEKTIPENAA